MINQEDFEGLTVGDIFDISFDSFDFSTFVSFGLASFIGISFEASLLIL